MKNYMNEVYNLRVGDMIYHAKAFNRDRVREDSSIMAVVYKTTPKYVYYAICARAMYDTEGEHFVTKDNRTKKETLYKSIRDGTVNISYAGGTKKRRKILNFEDEE